MKRFILPTLVAIGLFSSFGGATADVALYRKNVSFDIRRAAKAPNDWDSLVVHRAGARTDTSASFRLDGWARQSPAFAADSTILLAFEFGSINGSTITVGSGATTVTLQQSSDGSNWATVGASLAPFNAAPALTASSTGGYIRDLLYDAGISSDQIINTQLLRFIVNSAATGQQTLWVSWPRAVVPGVTKWVQ
jgi:hypothetical protein